VAVTRDSGTSYSQPGYTSGGTYTLTFAAYITGSINYNDTAGTVQTALNALASVTAHGGVTVTGTYLAGFEVTFNNPGFSSATVDIGSLTGSVTLSSSIGIALSGYAQSIIIGTTITAGTYTITLLGQTTSALNYNASTSTIQTALMALSNVVAAGGCSVNGTGFSSGSIVLNIQFNNPTVTANAALLHPPGTIILASGLNSQNQDQFITFLAPGTSGRIITAPSHGFVAGDTLCISGTNAMVIPGSTTLASLTSTLAYFDITAFTIVDANTISLSTSGSPFFSFLRTILQLSVLRVTNYQPAPTNARCQRITDYYLPGVTVGITTAADIVEAQPQSDPLAFLAGLVTAPTINYVVGEIEPWMGPILQQTKSVVAVADLGVTTINLT
jgi:hypothetical protein